MQIKQEKEMIRTTQVTIMKEGGCLFDDGNYVLTIEDLAGGEFVVVEDLQDEIGKIGIDPTEWPQLRKAIDDMIEKCQKG
jgi:hypothetical protein